MLLTCNIQCVFIAILTQEKKSWYFFSIPIIAACLFFFPVESYIKFWLNSRALVEENEMFLMSMNQKEGKVAFHWFLRRDSKTWEALSSLPGLRCLAPASLSCSCHRFLMKFSSNFLWPFSVSFREFLSGFCQYLKYIWPLFESLVFESTSYSRGQVSILCLAVRYSKCVKAMSIFTPNLSIDWLACTMEALTEILSQALQRSPIPFFFFFYIYSDLKTTADSADWSKSPDTPMSREPIILKL